MAGYDISKTPKSHVEAAFPSNIFRNLSKVKVLEFPDVFAALNDLDEKTLGMTVEQSLTVSHITDGVFVQAWAVGASLAAYAMTSQRSGVAVTLLCESRDAD